MVTMEENMVTMEEAAARLGFKTTRSIHNLVKKKLLSVFHYPHRRTPFLSIEEIDALLIPKCTSEREYNESS